MPPGGLFEIHDQVDAVVAFALAVAAAEDHLPLSINGAGLPRREAKRHQHRLEGLSDDDRRG